MFNGYVYKVDCNQSGKCYIGITTTSFDLRKKSHLWAAFNENHNRYGVHFYRAIRKYGVDAFNWNLIESIKDDSLEALINRLKELEINYVLKYDSFNNGYNGTPGGDLTFKGNPKVINMFTEDKVFIESGTVGSLSAKYSLDASAVCKVCNRIYEFTGESQQKRLVFRYEEDDFTEEDYMSLKKAFRPKRKGYHIKGYFLESGIEVFDFPSAKVASEATGFCSRSICNCASGKYKYAGKLDGKEITWKYIDNEDII